MSGEAGPRAITGESRAEIESYVTGSAQMPLEVIGTGPGDAFAIAMAERADVLAYLDRRIANAGAVAASSAADSETREFARDRQRQMQVIRDELAQGMHAGMAQVSAELLGRA